MIFSKRNIIYYLLFTFITFVYYSSAIKNGYSLDDQYIFNSIPAEGSSFKDIFSVFAKRFDISDYRPIAMFTFALEQFIQGSINPKVSHIINLLIYVILCCTIFYVLQRLPIKNAVPIALVTTLLFIVHPVHAGVVNNLKSRDGLFSMLFVVLALNSYINYEVTKKKFYFLFIALFFVLGVYSKRDAYNLIFILPLLAFFVYNRSLKKDILLYFVGLLVLMILSTYIINILVPYDAKVFEKSFMITENPLIADNTFFNRLGMSVATYLYYLKFMVIPKGYYFYFGFNMIPLRSILNPITLVQLVVVILPLFAAFIMYKKNKHFTLGILIFYSSLLYCANFVTEVQGIVADRYVFIASLGFIFAFAVLIVDFLPSKIEKQIANLSKTIQAKHIPIVITILIMLLYFPFVKARNNAWFSKETLFEADMPHLQQSFEANRIASTHYAQLGMNSRIPSEQESNFMKALQYAKQANALNSDDIHTQETEGIAYYGLGKTAEAEKQFLKIIKKFDTSVVSWDLMGDMTFKRQNFDSATLCYANVYRLEKSNESVYYKYPNALVQNGKRDSAFNFLEKLSKTYPDWYVPYESAAYLYYQNGDTYYGHSFLVVALEKGLNNRQTYERTKSEIIQGTQNPDVKISTAYKQLLVRLEKIPIPN